MSFSIKCKYIHTYDSPHTHTHAHAASAIVACATVVVSLARMLTAYVAIVSIFAAFVAHLIKQFNCYVC